MKEVEPPHGEPLAPSERPRHNHDPDAWLRAAHARPDDMSMLRSEVGQAAFAALSDATAIENCSATLSPIETELRFVADVEVSHARVRVGAWHFGRVVDGEPISDEQEQCFTRIIRGDFAAMIHVPDDLDYAGPVELELTVVGP